jgi:Thioredoxin
MTVRRERFEQGMTYDEFKAQMTRNRERLEANEHQLEIEPSDLAPFRALSRPLNVLVLAEDWCPDVIENLPVLGRLATESGALNVRVFLRDQHLDLMDQYLNQGKFRSIPTMVFFDDQFNEVGRFMERPESVTRRLAEGRRAIYAQHPELGSPETPVAQLPAELRAQLSQALASLRAELKPQEQREVVQALRAIVEQVHA